MMSDSVIASLFIVGNPKNCWSAGVEMSETGISGVVRDCHVDRLVT